MRDVVGKARRHITEVAGIHRSDARYPQGAMALLGDRAPGSIYALGNLDLLGQPMVALVCSSKCPGSVILRTYDQVCALRDAGVTVISGFHSPVEKECLRLLLRGSQPIIICPARSIERMRVPTEWRASFAAGRLLILSPFDAKHPRITAETAAYRNRFIAALADRILIPYAAPGSKTDRLCPLARIWGKPVTVLEQDSNAPDHAAGGRGEERCT